MPPLPDGPASTLDELYLTLSPEPLLSKDEFDRFYRGEVNKVRGGDTVARLSLKLQRSYGAVPFKMLDDVERWFGDEVVKRSESRAMSAEAGAGVKGGSPWALQEFNGKVWFGVHPLVVDILKEQGHLNPKHPGGTD